MHALDAAAGKIVWEYYLVPKSSADPTRGPQGSGAAPAATWNNAPGKVLWKRALGGAVSGGVITYDTGAGQKVAVSTGLQSKIWPTPKATAQIQVLAAE
jgi:alcohol dehydrogenase (cytochrome c)